MTATAHEKERQTPQQWLSKHGSAVASVSGLLFCIIFFTITTGIKGESIWSASKLSTLIGDVIVTALMAVGAVFIYSLGNMDVSIGKQVGLYSTLLVLIGNATGNLLIAILVCLVIAILIGIINGSAGELLHMYSVISSVVFMMVLSGVSTTPSSANTPGPSAPTRRRQPRAACTSSSTGSSRTSSWPAAW